MASYYYGCETRRRHALVHQALVTLLGWYEERALNPRPAQIAPLVDGGNMLQRLVEHQTQEKLVLTTR